MARYRKIDVRIHGDEKFKRLTPPKPCGQWLWMWLLTTKRTTSLPGLIEIGESALAEEIGWELKGLREAFRELLREGLVKADWKSRVIWIPNVIRYNRPENPNVVKGWSLHWDELPECALKSEAFDALLRELEGLGKGFAEAFRKGCAKSLANQEQEQEQEQEQDSTPLPPVGGTTAEPDSEPKRKRGRKGKPPADWQPTDAHRAIASERGVDFALELAKFRDHEFATPKSDYDATFRNWLRSATPQRQSRVAPRIGEPGWRRQPDGGINLDDYMSLPTKEATHG